MHPLLGLCACNTGHPAMYRQLAVALADFVATGGDWQALVSEAERQGMVPLLYTHCRSLGFTLPQGIRRLLQTLLLRAKQAESIRRAALAEIILHAQQEGIRLLVVKGMALGTLAYEEPVLRPMRDVDLLVAERDLPAMRTLLLELGFIPDNREQLPDDYYHLPPMIRIIDSYPLTIEVHRNLLPYHRGYPAWPLERSWDSRWEFTLETVRTATLGLEEMLVHVYLHGLHAPLTYESIRLVHIADVISLVHRYYQDLDWRKVAALWPEYRTVLAALQQVTPWPEEITTALALPVHRLPRGAVSGYAGWPRLSFAEVPCFGLPQLFQQTLWPSSWWLQVYYGYGTGWSGWRCRCLTHPLALYRWAKAYWLASRKERGAG